MDESITGRLLEKISESSREKYIAEITKSGALSREGAEAVFYFQINGCLALNRLLMRGKSPDWVKIFYKGRTHPKGSSRVYTEKGRPGKGGLCFFENFYRFYSTTIFFEDSQRPCTLQ